MICSDSPFTTDVYNETCEKTYASLLIYVNGSSISVVSDKMSIQATYSQSEGDKITTRLGTKRVAIKSFWELSSENIVKSQNARDHLDWLVDKLEKETESVRSLQRTKGVSMYVSCSWWSSGDSGGPTLYPKQMKALAELNLEISFDAYFLY